MPQDEFEPCRFVGVRARLQRFADAKCFSGWISSIDDIKAVIEVPSLAGFDIGQVFLLEASGMEAVATCKCEIKRMEGKTLRMTILTPVRLCPPYEDARIRQSCEGVMQVDGHIVPIQLEDVSAGGLGILSEESVPAWKSVLVMFQTALGGVRVTGQVRYCREVTGEALPFRIGLYAPEMEHSLPLFGIRSVAAKAA